MKLREIILFVQDMNTQVAFYRDKLGLTVTFPHGVDDYAGQFWVVFDTGSCALCLHAGGEKRFGEDAPKFVFTVDDIESAQIELLTRGVPMGKIRQVAPGIRVCDGYDPERNRFAIESGP